jgi:hypothetical protein
MREGLGRGGELSGLTEPSSLRTTFAYGERLP